MKTTLIRNAQIVDSDGFRQADLRIDNHCIQQVATNLSPNAADDVIDASGLYLIPGFVDIHNHGAVGFDCSSGRYDSANHQFDLSDVAYWQALEKALQFYQQTGTRRVLLTTVAAPLEDLEGALKLLDNFLKSHPEYESLVTGVNIEGTFIKSPAFAGAQNPEYFYPPDPKILDRLQKASGDRIRIVNIPPEHGSAGLDLMRHAQNQQIKIAGGHSAAFSEQFDEAIDAGLNLAVHFLNGPSRSSSKSFFNGGAIESILRRDEVFVELILDAYHVHPQYIRDVISRKGIERCIGITDSLFVNNIQDLDSFYLCGLKGQISENRAYLQVEGKANSLFGSVLNTLRGFNNLLNWLTRVDSGVWYRNHSAWSLEEALIAAVQICCSNPARLLGIDQPTENQGGIGRIAEGSSSDFLLLNIEGRAGAWQVELEERMAKV